MTTGVYLTCRAKPFERGVRKDDVTSAIIEAWRSSERNPRPGIVPEFVQPWVFMPSERREFFEEEVSVADWGSAPIADSTVFITTAPWPWSHRLVGGERPFLEALIEALRPRDPYATVGVAHILMGGSSNPPALSVERAPTVDALLAYDFTDGLLVETQLQPKEHWR